MSPDVAVMVAGLPRGVRLEQMSAAVLPPLTEGPSGIATEAWGMRWLAAADQAATRTTARPG
ncbi:hypothetical protein [Streptomyces sp. NBRC 109706]|uniref:hypothetical protein n=1 Tax=Streptomyces sp. NBRC 109706 TaxID=1550035 RepID=UPI00131BB942|nr:hypothetical protein [Streptomyces sp. NBRC 109706]